MSAGDRISKAAKDAMEDLAGTSEPSDDAHVPEPGDPAEPIKVNSSVSEATNATEAEREQATESRVPDHRSADFNETSSEGSDGGKSGEHDTRENGRSFEDGTAGREGLSAGAGSDGGRGPAGLPDPDPENGSAQPLESDQDPSNREAFGPS